jgi:hypothetical protein
MLKVVCLVACICVLGRFTALAEAAAPQIVTVTAVSNPAGSALHPGSKQFAVQPHLLCAACDYGTPVHALAVST